MLTFHPVADLFPMMSDEEYRSLVVDIQQYGQREPIWTLENQIIDGRNRYKACTEIGIDPDIEAYRGPADTAALVNFVVSLNLKRRHLTASQKAAVGVAVKQQLQEQNPAGGDRRSDEFQVGNISYLKDDDKQNRDLAGDIVGVSGRYIDEAEQLQEEDPDLFEDVKRGKTTIPKAKKAAKARKRKAETAALLHEIADVDYSDRYCVVQSAVASFHALGVDAIITDPPYPREYLDVYTDLAQFAARALKPGGSLIVMVGQSYLPDILARMTPHIRYHWTLAYLTPGGQAVQLWQRNVNTFWKPILWFVNGEYTGPWVGDVAKSDVNDNDKRFHHWGQSVSGMSDLIDRLTQPGDLICDPFCGAGTTGVAAILNDRRFYGADIDPSCVEASTQRLQEASYAGATRAERMAG